MAEPIPSNGPEKNPLAETIWVLVRVRDAVAGQNAPFIELLIIKPPRVIDAIDSNMYDEETMSKVPLAAVLAALDSKIDEIMNMHLNLKAQDGDMTEGSTLATLAPCRDEQTLKINGSPSISTVLGQVVLYPSGHPDRSSSLNNLVNAVRTRFEQLGQMEDLEESIQLQRDVASTWSSASRSLDVP